MCTDIDCFPHIMMITEKDYISSDEYGRRSSWAPSVSSSTSSTTTNPTSWMERKLFSHFKRFFRRNSLSSTSNSPLSSRRPSSTVEEVITLPSSEPPIEIDKKEEEEEKQDHENLPSSSSSISIVIHEPEHPIATNSNSIDLLYDYDRLLARCLERQEHHLTEMITRCQTPVTIPHADLIVGQSRTILINWKSYTRLFRALNRDSHLFQQYVNQHYGCQSSISQREQLKFNTRTTKTTFDNVLKSFLGEYVTCLACQKAQTHLLKSTGLWRIECQLCGSQRSVKRLRWKR